MEEGGNEEFDIHTICVYNRYMEHDYSPLRQRVNITLPRTTLQLLDRVVPKGKRSYFIDEAVREFVNERSREHLKAKLKEGALKRRDRDLNLAEEWFIIDDQVWQKGRG